MSKKSRYKIKPNNFSPEKTTIKPTIPADNRISFSFQYIREKNNKFKYSEKESQYFLKLIERLTEVCLMTKSCLVTNNSKALRSHKIKWWDTTENGFGLASEFNEEAFQLSISSNEHGRIHGFYVDSIFYIVWLDPKHELYS